MIRKNRLKNVEITGAISQPKLHAAFKTSALLLCMSEHEGFCIPLLEAMEHEIPILAYSAAAVPETLDGAGVLVRKKKFDLIAEMMGHLTSDTAFRERILEGQRQRLMRYKEIHIEDNLRNYLDPLLRSKS